MQLVIPLDNMSVSDKMEAMEEIWADLSRNVSDVPSPAWHADVLCVRESRISEGTSRFLDIAEAKQAVRERIK
ncbi:MAG: addiction module protein [Desulfovibrionales bacterium]|jgi:hypothetical protein|nr:addiction module protein [Desulfovibrionales bacterium]